MSVKNLFSNKKSIPWLKITVGIAILLAFLYINYIEIDPDLGWHLRIGQWEIEHRAIPHYDELSYTMPGYRWVNHEWLPDALLWLGYSKNLWWLIAAIFSALTFIPFFFWIKRSQSNHTLAFVGLGAVALIHAGIIGVRPQIISFFFFWLVFEILYRHYILKQKNKSFFILPLIFFIWANLHAGFAIGLFLWGVLIGLNLLMMLPKLKLATLLNLKYDLLILTACVLITFINPYGLELYKEIFSVALSGDTAKYITEWQSSLKIPSIYFGIILSAVCFFLLKYRKKYNPLFIATTIVFLFLFIRSLRFFLSFIVIAVPFTNLGINWLKEEVFLARAKQTSKKHGSFILKQGGKIVLILALLSLAYEIINFMPFPLPTDATAFLKTYAKKNPDIKFLNNYGWGGYLTWQLPELKIFIDGRMPHWQDTNGNSAMKDYIQIFYAQDKWREIFEKRKINIVLIPGQESITKKRLNIKIRLLLEENYKIKKVLDWLDPKRTSLKNDLLANDWQIIYQDRMAVILKKH